MIIFKFKIAYLRAWLLQQQIIFLIIFESTRP